MVKNKASTQNLRGSTGTFSLRPAFNADINASLPPMSSSSIRPLSEPAAEASPELPPATALANAIFPSRTVGDVRAAEMQRQIDADFPGTLREADKKLAELKAINMQEERVRAALAEQTQKRAEENLRTSSSSLQPISEPAATALSPALAVPAVQPALHAPQFHTASGVPLPYYNSKIFNPRTSSVKPTSAPVSNTKLHILAMKQGLESCLSVSPADRRQFENDCIQAHMKGLEKEITQQLDILGERLPVGTPTYSDHQKAELRKEYQEIMGFVASQKKYIEEAEKPLPGADGIGGDAGKFLTKEKEEEQEEEEELRPTIEEEKSKRVGRAEKQQATANAESLHKRQLEHVKRQAEGTHGSMPSAERAHDIWKEINPYVGPRSSSAQRSHLNGLEPASYMAQYPQYAAPSNFLNSGRSPTSSVEVKPSYSERSKEFSMRSEEFLESSKERSERSGRPALPYQPFGDIPGVRYLSVAERPSVRATVQYNQSSQALGTPGAAFGYPYPQLSRPIKDYVYDSATGKWGYKERQTMETIAGPPSKSLFENFTEKVQEQPSQAKKSLITKGLAREEHALKSPEAYTKPFCDFLTENPTVFHAVDYFEKKLEKAGFKKLSERNSWNEELTTGSKYFVNRNGSSLIAFSVGGGYKSGNGVAMIAGHVDALTARLKPVSAKKTSAGYVQLGVAPYAGALNTTWWDRDLGIAGKVLVKDSKTGKIITKLVKLGWPIARIPTLAPHFGVGMLGQNNAETQAVPIIGLDNSDIGAAADEEFKNFTLGGGAESFAATQPPRLVRAIAGELSIQDYSSIVNWELELFDTQPAQTGGLDKEFIFAGRVDDKLCSWAALEALLASTSAPTSTEDGIIKLVGLFDDEEIGSLLRQGARGNFLPSVIERISESFSKNAASANILSQTYANSFLVSADVIHAVNPNFLGSYLEGHAPRLNVGLVISGDSNGHMTTDAVSTALLTRVAEKTGSTLQIFQIRNDSRSGGTVGPMLSSAMGVRAVDAGIPQLSMHSIRATTGALDPGLGVKIFKGFLDHFEEVDKEFE